MFFDHRTLKAKRDAYISHLNRIYRNNLDKVNLFLFLDHIISRMFLGSEIISCLFNVCFICTLLRLKSWPFKVMPGLQMTLNQVLRLTVKSTPHLTSSSPPEGSQLFWVTLRYPVRQNHHYLFIISIKLIEIIQIICLLVTLGASLGITSDGFFELETLPK